MDNEARILKGQRTDKIALHKVSAFLLSREIITATPDVDINGADLLAIMRVQDGAKFARIQCKGRTLANPKATNKIEIEKSYVTGTFTLLLYLHCPYDSTEHLFCFFAYDIKGCGHLWRTTDNKYKLSLYAGTFKQKLDLFRFNESRVKVLKAIIRDSDMGKEFYYTFAEAKITIPAIELAGHISSL